MSLEFIATSASLNKRAINKYNGSMSFVKINDVNVHYEIKGDKGKNVVLLHGWGQNIAMMDYIAEFLKEHFVVYNLDLPCFGESDDPKVPWSVEDYSTFLKTFLEHFKVSNPIIIGHSFGCRIAIHYAYKNPVYKMVLTGAAGIRDKRTLKYYFKTYTYKLGKKLLKAGLFTKTLTKLQANAGSEDYKNSSGIKRATFVKVVNDDVTPMLKSIKTPTLLVFGQLDEATPVSKGKMMEKLMGDATLVIFENDDHFAYFHQGDRFNRVLEAYLKEDYE